MIKVVIIDYGLGNPASVKNMLKSIGIDSCISNKEEDFIEATHFILPGVGHFGKGIENLKNISGFKYLEQRVLMDKIPFLGICLGMQLLTNGSDEAKGVQGLGWIPGYTHKFEFSSDSVLKVPHMGWSELIFSPCLLFEKLEEPRFYFVHSYFVSCENKEHEIAHTNYGSTFCCAIQKNNIYGVQFHPEKSHVFGKQLLHNFVNHLT